MRIFRINVMASPMLCTSMIDTCLGHPWIHARNPRMRTLSTNLLLALFSRPGFGLSSACQIQAEAAAPSAISDRIHFNTETYLVAKTARLSGQTLTTSAPRADSQVYSLPVSPTGPPVRTSTQEIDGYRAAVYYVNWVSDSVTI